MGGQSVCLSFYLSNKYTCMYTCNNNTIYTYMLATGTYHTCMLHTHYTACHVHTLTPAWMEGCRGTATSWGLRTLTVRLG